MLPADIHPVRKFCNIMGRVNIIKGTDVIGLSNGVKEKYRKLIDLIRGLQSVAVAYSGGVDSTLLAVICNNVLGELRPAEAGSRTKVGTIAVTAQSETYPSFELEEAIQIACRFKFTHQIIKTLELELTSFRNNPPERCYYCKTELFKKLRAIADKENVAFVLDGTTLSDVDDYRPGRKAAIELGVRSPLMEVRLDKKEVRILSRFLGLPTWDKPAYACLASRFPYGTKLTESNLKKVEAAEDFLRTFGFKTLRVRYHEEIARIEVAPDEIPRLIQPAIKEGIINKFRSLGFLYFTIDLEGYRSGSMNTKILQKGNSQASATAVADIQDGDEIIDMTCPRCQSSKMEKVIVRHGGSAEGMTQESKYKQCTECGGIWFELNELERALGKKIQFGVPVAAKSNNNVSHAYKPFCPLCRTQLIHIKSLDVPELGVEACLICQGRWVDGAEIKKLQEHGFFKQVKSFVMRLFSL